MVQGVQYDTEKSGVVNLDVSSYTSPPDYWSGFAMVQPLNLIKVRVRVYHVFVGPLS